MTVVSLKQAFTDYHVAAVAGLKDALESAAQVASGGSGSGFTFDHARGDKLINLGGRQSCFLQDFP